MKEVLKVLLHEFSRDIKDTINSNQREAPFIDVQGMINVAIGTRSCGKTYLTYQKIRELLK